MNGKPLDKRQAPRREQARREDDITALERTLPHNLEAERAVLGAILLSNPMYDRAARHVQAASFYRDAHRRIWSCMTTILERPGGMVDMTTLREGLTQKGDLDEVGGPSYLSALVDGVPHATNIEHYAQIVKEKATLRGIIYAANAMLTEAYCAEEASATILAQGDQALVDLQHGAGLGRMRSLTTRGKDILDLIEHRVNHKGQLTGVTTGFDNINGLTFGWQRGDLVVLAARPSIGKTTFVMNSAAAAAESLRDDGRQRHVALFSLEMKREQLEMRLLSSITNIDHARLNEGRIYEQEWALVSQGVGRISEMNLHIDDAASRTVGNIRSECRRLRSEHGLDLVVVDYIQLMPGSLERRGATRNEEITDISRKLKIMADDLSVPVVVLSQLKRVEEARRPHLSDLRESGALEQDADIVGFLHRKNHREGGPTEFIVEKQRNGPTGTEMLHLTRETCTFTVGQEPLPAPTPEEKKTRAQRYARRAHA